MSFQLTNKAIDPSALREELLSFSAGAYCSYEGWVRNHNASKEVIGLHYYTYAELVGSIEEIIFQETKVKFKIENVSAVHRVGFLSVGDLAVWIGVTARHRNEAFLACRYVIDNIKYRMPIWKKESYADGTEAWIHSNTCNCADPRNLNFT